MTIGGGIALIVIGAILSFAVRDSVSGIDLGMIGYICMAAGAVGIILGFVVQNRKTTSVTQQVQDPATGSTTTRHDSSGPSSL